MIQYPPARVERQNKPIKQINTNLVIEQKSNDGDHITFYIPAYISLSFNNLIEIRREQMSGKILATIIISLGLINFRKYIITNYGDHSFNQLYYILTKKIKVSFSRDDTILIGQDNQNISFKEHQQSGAEGITFFIRKQIQFDLQAQRSYLAPFQLIKLMMSLSIKIDEFCTVGITNFQMKFNCMNSDDLWKKFSFNPKRIRFGQHFFIPSKREVNYSSEKLDQEDQDKKQQAKPKNIPIKRKQPSNNQGSQSMKLLVLDSDQQQKPHNEQGQALKQKQQKQVKFKQYKYAKFTMYFYRSPLRALFAIIIPLLFLSIINIFIMFQQDEFSSRLASIAAVMVSISVLIPALRELITPDPKFTFIQCLIYCEILASLLTLIQSFFVSYKNKADPGNNKIVNATQRGNHFGFYIANVAFTAIVVVFLVFMVVYFFIKKHKYGKLKEGQSTTNFKIFKEKTNWTNQYCNKKFREYQIQKQDRNQKQDKKQNAKPKRKQQLFKNISLQKQK